MRSLFQRRVRQRTVILTFFFMLWLIIIIIRLVQFQVIEHSHFKADVLTQNQNIDTIIPKRGSIYDRTGIILARSVPIQSVFYTPFKDEPYDLQFDKIKKLKEILGLSQQQLQVIKKRIEKNISFIWISRKINPEKAEIVKKLKLTGVYQVEENKRFFPQGKRAAHTLGRVNIDDSGVSGVEYKYNSILEGEKGKRLIMRDAKRRGYRLEILKDPIPGKDLFLTIDETVQYIAEKELKQAVHEKGANWGTVIISQPTTGEILAMANYPTYDLNEPPFPYSLLDRNRAIHHAFDPGSTFKIITASSALESKKVNLAETFDCSEDYRYAGRIIKDYKRFGLLSFPEVIIHSSNVGAIQIGQRTGEENFYSTIKAFGFGEKTGIDLPGEEKGIFRPVSDWTELSVPSISIGYEISVTALQMLQAINIIANKGVVIDPKIVRKISVPSEEVEVNPPQGRRAISEETASSLALILQKVVEEGTGRSAEIKGYKIAGKTGTAQKIDPSSGRYSSTSHTASFVGFVVADEPVFSMIVVIDDPKDQYYGSQVAAPVFRDIALQVLRYLKIPRQNDYPKSFITARNWRQEEK